MLLLWVGVPHDAICQKYLRRLWAPKTKLFVLGMTAKNLSLIHNFNLLVTPGWRALNHFSHVFKILKIIYNNTWKSSIYKILFSAWPNFLWLCFLRAVVKLNRRGFLLCYCIFNPSHLAKRKKKREKKNLWIYILWNMKIICYIVIFQRENL